MLEVVLLFAIGITPASRTGPTAYRGGEEHPKRALVVAFAKRIDVTRLDSSLPTETLDHFLSRVLPKASRITWGSSDCENKPPSFPRPPETPLCASIHANVFDHGLRLEVVVGSHGFPISGQPRIEKLYLLDPPAKAGTPVRFHFLKSLSDLQHVSK